MGLLVVVITLMVACVQFGFRGLDVLYSRDEVEQWLPFTVEDRQVQLARMADMQQADMAKWRIWHARSRFAYNWGIVLLGVGVALVVAPPVAYQDGHTLSAVEATIRWVGSGVAMIATLCELIWMLKDRVGSS